MLLKILGTAAGGGFPQWNCACVGCTDARQDHSLKRLHACAAISADGKRWFLLNAPPDVASQIEAFESLHPGPAVRETNLAGVLLTDAELDHTIGLLVLREQSALEVFCTGNVERALHQEFPVSQILQHYTGISWKNMQCQRRFALEDESLLVTAFSLGNKKPRYATDASGKEEEWVVGLHIEDPRSGASIVYAPSIERWSEELTLRLQKCNFAFIDGTFWSDDDMSKLGISKRSAQECGHLALSGHGGLLHHCERLFPVPQIHLTHINNTNPLLHNGKALELPEHVSLAREGMLVEV